MIAALKLMGAALLRGLCAGVVAGLVGYAAYALHGWLSRRPRAEGADEFDDVLDSMPRITLPWGAIPAGVH